MLIRSLEPTAGNRPACFGNSGEGMIVPKGSLSVDARATVIGIKIFNEWTCAPSLQWCVIGSSHLLNMQYMNRVTLTQDYIP